MLCLVHTENRLAWVTTESAVVGAAWQGDMAWLDTALTRWLLVGDGAHLEWSGFCSASGLLISERSLAAGACCINGDGNLQPECTGALEVGCSCVMVPLRNDEVDPRKAVESRRDNASAAPISSIVPEAPEKKGHL